MDNNALAALRQEYLHARLDESDAAPDPYAQFAKWFDESLKAQLPQGTAMTLATAGADGAPDARTVLLKGFSAGPQDPGFVFFTNYTSRKGRELAENARATLLFYWAELERQVRIEGTVSKVPAGVSDEYFASRPAGSRLGAIASPQSEVIVGRIGLEARVAELARQYGDNPPRPDFWGGYRVEPYMVEFWQGRADRLHDRLRYRASSFGWIMERLAP
jgi:pyridoxamine 5'-phosphate oxidase